jgi:hypothetical protein
MGKGHIRAPDSGFANRKFDTNRQHKVSSRRVYRTAPHRLLPHAPRTRRVGRGALLELRVRLLLTHGARPVMLAACAQEKTGQYNFKTGKRERDALKAGKGSAGPSKSSLCAVCTVVLFGALLLAAFVYYLAALELEGEEEVEVDDKS